MKISEGIDELQRFSDMLKTQRPEMGFDISIVERRNDPFKDWYKMEFPGVQASQKSGVYFITDIEEDILYIGKAGANNLGAEIWGKFRAPNEDKKFLNSPLAKWAPDDTYRDAIIDGSVLIAAVVIQPIEHASLAEVYLHVWCSMNSGLPPLNKRIG